MHNTINVDDWCDGIIETCDQCTPHVQMQSAFAKIYIEANFVFMKNVWSLYISVFSYYLCA